MYLTELGICDPQSWQSSELDSQAQFITEVYDFKSDILKIYFLHFWTSYKDFLENVNSLISGIINYGPVSRRPIISW